jgi:hypothetical protein
MRCPALSGGTARRARLARTGRCGRVPRAGRGAGPRLHAGRCLRGPRWPARAGGRVLLRRTGLPPTGLYRVGRAGIGLCRVDRAGTSLDCGRWRFRRTGLGCGGCRFRGTGLGCGGWRFRRTGLGCGGCRFRGTGLGCGGWRFRRTGLRCGGCRFRGTGLRCWALLGGARLFLRRAGVGDRFGRGRVDESVRANLTGCRSRPGDGGWAGLRVVPARTGRRPSVCVDNARHNAYPRCTALPVIIRRDILTAALLRARLPGQWSRAPVASSRWGWHSLKIQAL